MSDNVVPFGRRGGRAAAAPPAASGLSKQTRRAHPRAQELAAEQNADARIRHREAATKQKHDRLIAAGRVVAARITLAMNLGTFPDGSALEGPQVDIACGTWEGNPDGDVDGWELAEAVPSREQVRLIAALTGFWEAWFYLPMKPGPLIGRDGEPGFIWLCGPRGCTVVKSDWVDERGVLHYGADPDDERQPRTVVQGALPIPGAELTKSAPKLKKTTPRVKKTPPAAQQPMLPTSGRMPEHLRADLAARIDQARQRRR